MPTYVIEGKTVKTEAPLSETEIDEIAGSLKGSKPKAEVSTLDFLTDKAKQGFSNAAAFFAEGAISGQGSMSEVFTGRTGTYQPIKSADIQRDVAGVKNLKAPNDVARYAGAAVEAATDPVSYLFPMGGAVTRGFNAVTSGLFSEGGGDLFGGVEKALTGKESGIPRAVGNVVGGVVSPVATLGSRTAIGATANTAGQIWDKYKAVKVDPNGASDAIAAGSAKRLLEHAAKAEGVENIDDILKNFRQASQYVTGTDVPLLVAMSGNPIMREQIVRLAKTNPEYRGRLQAELDRVAASIDKKAATIFGERFADIPAGEKGISLKNVQKRIDAVDEQLGRLTDPFTASSTRTDVGEAVTNLVEAKKAAVKAKLSPEYQSLIAESKKAGVVMPAEASEELFTFVQANNLRDIFGKNTKADRKVMSVLGGDVQTAAGLESRTFKEMSFEDVDSLKRLINEQQRVIKDPAQQAKLRQLEEYFDGVKDRYIPEWSAKLKDIDKKYFDELGVPFGAQGVKDIDSAKYASRVAPVIVNNRQSFRDFMRVAGDEGVAIAENAMLAKANDVIKGDMLSSPALQAFIKKNKEVLDEPQMARVKQLLTDSLADNSALRAEKARIEVAAQAAQKRVADNFLTSVDKPNYETVLSGILTDPRSRAKTLRDIKDLSPDAAEAVRGSLRAELAHRALNSSEGSLAFLTDKAHKAGIESVMGTGYQESLRKISLLSDSLRKADIQKLSVELEKTQLDAIGKVVPGLDLPYVTSTVRDRISSTTQKIVRILTRVNTAQAQTAFDRKMMELLTDPNGVQKLAATASDLNFKVKNPVDLKKVVTTFLNSIPANVYIGLQNDSEEE